MSKKKSTKKIPAPQTPEIGDRVRVIAASDETPEMVGKVGVLKEIDKADEYPFLVQIDQVMVWAQSVEKTKRGAPAGNQNGIGNTGGRPTKYDPSFKELLVKFFDIEPMKEYVYESSKEMFANGTVKKISEKKRLMPTKMPTLYRFSKSIGVDYSTMLNWATTGGELFDEGPEKGKPKNQELFEFSSAYKEAKEIQQEFLIDNGLAGNSPPSAYIFTAKNVTPMRDKTETDLTSGGKPLGVIMLPPTQAPTPPPADNA